MYSIPPQEVGPGDADAQQAILKLFQLVQIF
jgi:hypothetical protein